MKLLKKIYSQSPLVRLALSPLRNAQRAMGRSRHLSQMNNLRFLVNMLVEDPVLYVEEFQGRFTIGRRSSILEKLLVDGTYETRISCLVPALISPSKDAIDVGANLGVFSVFLAKLLPQNRGLAFEPVLEALQRLNKNLADNGVADHVSICSMIANDAPGQVEMKIIVGQEEYSTIGLMEHPNVSKEKFETRLIQCTTIDSQIETLQLRPGFIKIDAEGSEASVLRGATNTLRNHRPVILSEFSSNLLSKNGSSAEAVLNFLQEHDYVAIDPFDPLVKFFAKDFGDALFVPSERRDEIVGSVSRINQKLVGQ